MLWKLRKKQEAIYSAVVDLDEELANGKDSKADHTEEQRDGFFPDSPVEEQTVRDTGPCERRSEAARPAPAAVAELEPLGPLPTEPAAAHGVSVTEPQALPASVSSQTPAAEQRIDELKIAAVQAADLCFPELQFVYIPHGTFIMGSPAYEAGRNNDEVQHGVIITQGFYLQVTPVTIGQWKAVMGANPSCFPDVSDDCPVDGTSWIECQQFIKQLNAKGEARYRLPTEAEWEYACRAGSSTAFANGNIDQLFCGLDRSLVEMGWYCGNSGRRTHRVRQKKPNAWGLYDMHGNVLEWCEDWYGEYPSASQQDPSGPSFGPGRVIRGGSWFSSAKSCRSASRSYWVPDAKSDFIGFRLVKEIVSV